MKILVVLTTGNMEQISEIFLICVHLKIIHFVLSPIQSCSEKKRTLAVRHNKFEFPLFPLSSNKFLTVHSYSFGFQPSGAFMSSVVYHFRFCHHAHSQEILRYIPRILRHEKTFYCEAFYSFNTKLPMTENALCECQKDYQKIRGNQRQIKTQWAGIICIPVVQSKHGRPYCSVIWNSKYLSQAALFR